MGSRFGISIKVAERGNRARIKMSSESQDPAEVSALDLIGIPV